MKYHDDNIFFTTNTQPYVQINSFEGINNSEKYIRKAIKHKLVSMIFGLQLQEVGCIVNNDIDTHTHI